MEGRPVKATNRGQPWKEAEQLTSTDFFQRIHHYFNEIGASPRMRQEFADYHAGKQARKLDDGWPESEKGKDVDVKYIEERRRCEKISEERMNI